MTRTVTAKPIEQQLKETIRSALRGLKNLKGIELTASAYLAANDRPLESIKVDRGMREDILTCMRTLGYELGLKSIWVSVYYEYNSEIIKLEFV